MSDNFSGFGVDDFEANTSALRVLANIVRVIVDDSHVTINLSIDKLSLIEIVLLVNKSSDTVRDVSNGLASVRSLPVGGDQEDLYLNIFLPGHGRIHGGRIHVVLEISLHLIGHRGLFLRFEIFPDLKFLGPLVSSWIFGGRLSGKEIDSFLWEIVGAGDLFKELLSLYNCHSSQ